MTDTVDCEKASCSSKQRLDGFGGYARLARVMGDVPDVAIFKRFAHLSVESLLHYQAEICSLEKRLAEFQSEDKEDTTDSDRRWYAFNSQTLRDSADGDEGEDPNQWQTILRLRELLKEYYAAMLLHQQVVDLNKPQQKQLQALRDWMFYPHRGRILLADVDVEVWKTTKLEELVTLEPKSTDGVTFSKSTLGLVRLYHRFIGRYLHKQEPEDHFRNSVVYRDDGVFKVIRVIKTLAACLMPIVGIVVLYVVQDMAARLGIIAAFTAIFAFTLCYFTPAGIKDIFSATAAFSAVLVVFVGATD